MAMGERSKEIGKRNLRHHSTELLSLDGCRTQKKSYKRNEMGSFL
jgi:hypothetical protein